MKFKNGKVLDLKTYLLSQDLRRKQKLVELVEKARDLSLERLDDWVKPEAVIVNKLQMKEGSFPVSTRYTLTELLTFLIFRTSYTVTCTLT